MMRKAWICLVGLTLLCLGACGKRGSYRLVVEDPAAVVAGVRARKMPENLQASFRIELTGPEGGGSTVGGMVVARPDRIRMDIQTPFRTPLFIMATDGKALHVWDQQRSTFLRGDDAIGVLGEMTGGAVVVADLATMLIGGLPLPGATVGGVGVVGERVEVRLNAPGGLVVQAGLEPRRLLVEDLRIGRGDAACVGCSLEPVFARVNIEEHVLVNGDWLPQELRIELPGAGWTIELSVKAWEQLSQVPDVFTLAPPPGATEADLIQRVKQAVEKRAAYPAP